MAGERAVILQHPSASVVLIDPRHQEVLAATSEPSPLVPAALYAPEQPTEEQWAILAVQNGIYEAIQRYGAQRVAAWVRNLAAIAGQAV